MPPLRTSAIPTTREHRGRAPCGPSRTGPAKTLSVNRSQGCRPRAIGEDARHQEGQISQPQEEIGAVSREDLVEPPGKIGKVERIGWHRRSMRHGERGKHAGKEEHAPRVIQELLERRNVKNWQS